MMGIKEHIRNLLRSNNTPHEIAFGVAIGVFIGIMPLYGLHIFLALLFAMVIPDVNKIAILLGTNISIPPAIPLTSWISYNIGRAILGNSCPALRWDTLMHFRYADISAIYYPLFVGSIVWGIICSGVFYFLMLFLAEKYMKKRKRSFRFIRCKR